MQYKQVISHLFLMPKEELYKTLKERFTADISQTAITLKKISKNIIGWGYSLNSCDDLEVCFCDYITIRELSKIETDLYCRIESIRETKGILRVSFATLKPNNITIQY